ncbi:MAG: DUF2974 domain-containing protein [Lachnospiraceae bacterium]|nr:DUF2974 domain-containing protein [Lachnospiraceae bacterium]
MSELSERELLLLSNYLYIDECTQYGTVGEFLDSTRNSAGNISYDKVSGLGLGGCMTTEEGCDLLHEMDISSDEFKNLTVTRSIDEGGIRALCFAASGDDSNATVVFRGTGGSYEAWADNIRGEYMPDTKMQKLADDFVRYDCGIYDNITVSGHSKGGNMSQFVTVTNPDRVQRCVSFDGQGFGRNSISAYKPQMREVSGRIKSISAHNDYVNILLGCIAGECVYVKNIRNDAVGRHSSYSLLKSCEFDEEGNISNTCGQDLLTAVLAGDIAKTVALIDRLPEKGNVSVSELLASGTAALLSDEFDNEYEKSRALEAASGVGNYVTALFGLKSEEPYDLSIVTDSVYIDVNGLGNALIKFRSVHEAMVKISDRLLELRHMLNYKAASRLAVDMILKRQESVLKSEEGKLLLFIKALEDITCLYTSCENELVTCINEAVIV